MRLSMWTLMTPPQADQGISDVLFGISESPKSVLITMSESYAQSNPKSHISTILMSEYCKK